jgi:hypothetical protein
MLLDGRFISNSLDFSDANHMARMFRQCFSCTNWLESSAPAHLMLAGGITRGIDYACSNPDEAKRLAPEHPANQKTPEKAYAEGIAEAEH